MPEVQLDASHIMDVGMGFWPSKTLLSAVGLDLFSHLGGESMTGEEVGKRLGLHSRATSTSSTPSSRCDSSNAMATVRMAAIATAPRRRHSSTKRVPLTSAGSSRCATSGSTGSGVS